METVSVVYCFESIVYIYLMIDCLFNKHYVSITEWYFKFWWLQEITTAMKYDLVLQVNIGMKHGANSM